ncbi:hypothetical protein ACQUQU_15195 [Thalassolituus sp. LLYu03]|uniref:hypothetical protein n=1 Tax=Thalassolituus sp. LLYu03 TaxID=3421656 RepID=UPI003D2B15B2
MKPVFSLGLMAAGALALTGCFDDDNKDSAASRFLKDHQGQYSAAYEQDGHAAQLRLALTSKAAVLMLISDRDELTAYSGRYADNALTFSNGAVCELDTDASCTLDAVTLTLSAEALTAPDLQDAAADYASAGNQTLSLSVAGEADIALDGCTLTVTLVAEDSGLLRAEQAGDCGRSAVQGVAYEAGDGHDISALQLVLPGSDVSGYWTRTSGE